MSGSNMVIMAGLPDGLVGVIGAIGVLMLVLMVLAFAAYVYKSLTGGIEWPEDREESDEVTRSHNDDDEWKYS